MDYLSEIRISVANSTSLKQCLNNVYPKTSS